MTEIEFYPIDFDSVVHNDRSYVRVFGRTAKGERICVYDQFDQYFWAIPKEQELAKSYQRRIEQIKLPGLKRTTYVKKTELHNKKYLGKDVSAVKVFLNYPSEISEICEEISNFREDFGRKEIDIPITKKYLIERKIIPLCLCRVVGNRIESSEQCELIYEGKVSQINEDILNPKILSFDIETYSTDGRRSNAEKDAIIMISFFGSDGFKKTLTWKKFESSFDIEFLENEGMMINRFKDVIKQYRPDYLIGYYSDGFDFPYIKARADKFKIKLDLGLDESNIKQSTKNRYTKINGFAHLDVLKIVKDLMSGDVASGAFSFDSFDLNSVAKFLLGKEKIDVNLDELGKAWDENKHLEKYCLYNLKDAELCYEIFARVLQNLNEIVKIVGQPVFNISRMTYGQLVEWHIIKNIDRFNEIIPNKPGFDKISARKEETFQGGFVYQPEAGLYDELVVLDFRSLYPSVICAHNICVSTLTDSKEGSNETPDIDGEKYYFSYKFEGFIPQIVKTLIERRIRIKELLKDSNDPVLKARSYALKILANASWGYFGFFGARWYNIKCAKSITAFTRGYLMKLIEAAKQSGFKIIYADTDSVFLSLEGKKLDDVYNFVEKFNSGLPSLMELDFEKKYDAGIFVMKKGDSDTGAKKKYALIDGSGKIKVRGFETVRRDWSYLAREVQNRVLEIILKEKDKRKALEYVKNVIDNLKNKRLSILQMIIRTQLKKNIGEYDTVGPHVAVARRMMNSGINVGPGSIIQYVICEGKGLIRDKARSADEATDYDAEYYIDNQIIPSVERIFEVIGYSRQDLTGTGEQMRLGEF